MPYYDTISEYDKQQLKAAVNIVDVVSKFMNIKKAGNTWKGKSPWNNERTPSFNVHEEKQFFKDFSSGKGGT